MRELTNRKDLAFLESDSDILNTVLFFFLIKILSISAVQCCVLSGTGIKHDKLSTFLKTQIRKILI